MEKLKNLSIRKSILLYMMVSLVCSFFLSAVVVGVAYRTQEQIWLKYVDQESYFDAQRREDSKYLVSIRRPNNNDMDRIDRFISETCDFLETYGILVISAFGSCMAVFLFYRNKLKVPLEELSIASKNIAKNDLDFKISYKNQDEMGQLCNEFDRMRDQLMKNNRILWQNLEEEKLLRSAIAHDIRSPLSVLKGYQEMLIEYVPNGVLEMDKTVDMLKEGMKQIHRIDDFVETMRKMNRLENREFQPRHFSALELRDDVQLEVNVLKEGFGKEVCLHVEQTDETFYGDKEIILEVTENVIGNALRYAKKEVKIEIQMTEVQLSICVMDDGNGFTEDSETVTKAYYQKNAKDSLEHAGLGMYISRLYCEKHRGKLMIENNKQGGASVTAVFVAFSL